MAKELYIRFTNNITKDIERGTSLNTANGEIIDGLCAFPGKSTIEETHQKAKIIGKMVGDEGDNYVILKAYHNIHAKSGSLGVVIMMDEIEVIEFGVV